MPWRFIKMTRAAAVVAALLAGATCSSSSLYSQEAITLEVSAGNYDRENTVVSMDLPPALKCHSTFALTELDTSRSEHVQVDPTSPGRVAWLIRVPLAAGKVRKYCLAVANSPQPAPNGVTVENDGMSLVAKVGGHPVFRYNHAVVSPPDTLGSYYARSGYIHPVFTPAGTVVTDDFNPRNPHQHGVMLAWRKATFEGQDSDCWDERLRHGKVEHVKLAQFGGGEVFGYFIAQLRHVSLAVSDAPKAMLNETWRVRLANVDKFFLFDFESIQSAADDSPLTVEKFEYGGLAIRAAAAWGRDGGRGFDFLTSEGQDKRNGNHTRPRWVDIFGTTEGQKAGVAIMDHPGNYRFPQPVRLHPTLPYFCFSPPVLGSFSITPTQPYVSRYRFVVHDGAPDAKLIERLWHDFASPPQVRIISEQGIAKQCQ